MGIGKFFQKIVETIDKQNKKSKLNSEKNQKILEIKETYLARLSHKDLVSIYKTYFGE